MIVVQKRNVWKLYKIFYEIYIVVGLFKASINHDRSYVGLFFTGLAIMLIISCFAHHSCNLCIIQSTEFFTISDSVRFDRSLSQLPLSPFVHAKYLMKFKLWWFLKISFYICQISQSWKTWIQQYLFGLCHLQPPVKIHAFIRTVDKREASLWTLLGICDTLKYLEFS